MPIPELAGVLKPQKVHDEVKRKTSHFGHHDVKPATVTSADIKKTASPINKEGPTDMVIEENVDCINVEIISREERLKVRGKRVCVRERDEVLLGTIEFCVGKAIASGVRQVFDD